MAFNKKFIYWGLTVLRVLLVVAPQTGYVHPDEFFQSIEVFAGKLFEVSSRVPWEFNVTFPLRSVALSYGTIGASLKVLKSFDFLAREYLHLSTLITPYFLLVFPRFLMCCLSFVVDYCMYKICVNNNEKYLSRILVLASSYVMIVYGTRTFSNTLELVLFALLLYFVAESLTFSNTVIKKREYINMRYRQSKNAVDKVKWNRLSSYLKSDSLRNCFLVSTVTVLGFFNRPTFLAFAVGPIFFWLYRGIGCKSVATLQFHLRSIMFIVCAIPTVLFLIIFDSFYYGYITWGEIGVFHVSINSFVFTPLNFIKYNIDAKNLKEHGLHPRWLHLFINIPLLFNVLGVMGIAGVLKCAYRFLRCQYHLLPTVRSIKGLMMLAACIPVALLSIFPHQEPRFLIPILFPLTYLYSASIYEETETALVRVSKRNKRNLSVAAVQKGSNGLFKFWFILNAIFVVFYGFVHQAGVLPAVATINEELAKEPVTTKFHVFTSHVYSVPESFLLQPDPNKLYIGNKTKYNLNKRCFLHEEGSTDLDLVLRKIKITLEISEVEAEAKQQTEFKFYFILPRSLEHHLQFLLDAEKFDTINAEKITSVFPHLSVESLPDLTTYCVDVYPFFNCKPENVLPWRDYISRIVSLCGLDVYEISRI